MNKICQHFKIDQGGYLVEALLQRIGDDYLLTLWGGVAHIGAVAMAQPRPSLSDPNRTSSSSSVFCYVGHKEDVLIKPITEQLSAALEAKIVVTAGLHWDHLTPEGIHQVEDNVHALMDTILHEVKDETRE